MRFYGNLFIIGVVLSQAVPAHALLSVGSANTSVNPVVSQDGTFVVYESDTSSGHQIFRTNTSAIPLTEIVSTDANGTAGAGQSIHPSISPDGRFFAFENDSNFFPGAKNKQIYWKDMTSGKLFWISQPMLPVPVTHDGPVQHNFPVVSNDGQRVYFQSNSQYLVPGGDVVYRIYEKSVDSGAVRVVSTSTSGALANAASMMPNLDPSGRYLFFESTATNLVAGSSGYQIFRKDLQTGETILVSANTVGSASDGSCSSVSASRDSRKVVFLCQGSNLVAGISGLQTYLKDLETGDIRAISAGYSNPILNAAGTVVTLFDQEGVLRRLDLITNSESVLETRDPFTIFQKISTSLDDSSVVFSAHSSSNSTYAEIFKASVATDFHTSP